jgi:hypothetical protein
VIWRKPLALAADAGAIYGISIRFSPESPAEAEFNKRAFIDGTRFCHIGLVWESAHRNPRLDHFSSSQFVESPMRLGSGKR